MSAPLRKAGAIRAVVLAGLLPMLIAARYYVLPAPDLLLPDASGYARGAIISVPDGGTIFHNPVAMTRRVTLSDAVSVATPGLSKSFAAGDRLLHVSIWATGRLTAHLPAATHYYCDPSERPRSRSIWESPSVIQTGLCFYDRDGDDVLDGAFWGNARRSADQVMVPIPPTRIAVERNVAIGESSYLKLVFAGADGFDGNLRFDLLYMSCGHPLSFTHLGGSLQRTVISQRRGFPRTLVIAGAMLTVMGYDPATRIAQVRIDRPMMPGEVGRNQTPLPPAVCY